MLLYDDLVGLVYLFHPFPGFEWPLLPWCPTFLEVLSGVYAGIFVFLHVDFVPGFQMPFDMPLH